MNAAIECELCPGPEVMLCLLSLPASRQTLPCLPPCLLCDVLRRALLLCSATTSSPYSSAPQPPKPVHIAGPTLAVAMEQLGAQLETLQRMEKAQSAQTQATVRATPPATP